jgi:hypothetical protein
MSIAKYIMQQNVAVTQWPKTLSEMSSLAKSKGVELRLTGHFSDRLQTRVARPVEFTGAFQIAVRAALARVPGNEGKKIGAKINDHVFIFSCENTRYLQLVALTFWICATPKKVEEIMSGVDIKLEL